MSKTETLQNTELTHRAICPGFPLVRLAVALSHSEVCDIGKPLTSDQAVICGLQKFLENPSLQRAKPF